MTNSIIHLVTNRSGDFHHPSLGAVRGYTPHRETDDETTLRTFLQLRDTSTDYYVIGAIASVYAFPDLVREYKESSRTFDLTSWRKDEDGFYPGKFVNTRRDAFNVHRVAQEFPVEMEWLLSYLDAQTLLVRLGSTRYNVPVREAGGILYAEWPEELGIKGAIELSGSWDASTFMTLIHTPGGFPYTVLAEKLRHRDDARRLMTDRGYMSHFYAAQSAIEKCAIAYTALAWPTQHV
jgi:hypothetical protein